MGEKKTLANDVHQIASKVWTRVWITHLSSHTSLLLFLFQLYIYLCSGWVMCWAPICHWSQPRSDRNRTSSLSYYQTPFFPFPPSLHPPLRLMQIVLLWFFFPFLVRYCASLPQFCWKQDDRPKTGKHLKKALTQVYLCGRKIERRQKRALKRRVALTEGDTHPGRCRSLIKS